MNLNQIDSDSRIEAERLFLMRQFLSTEPAATAKADIRCAIKCYDQTLVALLRNKTDLEGALAELLKGNSLARWGDGYSRHGQETLESACIGLKLAFLRCSLGDTKVLVARLQSAERLYGADRPNLLKAVADLEPALNCAPFGSYASTLADRLVRVAKALKFPLETGTYPDGLDQRLMAKLAGPLIDLMSSAASIYALTGATSRSANSLGRESIGQ